MDDCVATGEDGAAGRETLLSPMRSSHKKGSKETSFSKRKYEKYEFAGGHCSCGAEISLLITVGLHSINICQIS